MEMFDVVDEAGLPTGEVVSRRDAHRLGIRHRTAHVWIIRERGGKQQVLLQKRSLSKDSFPGQLDTSSAGHIPAGSEPVESALRELREELGLSAGAEELCFAGQFRIRYEKEFYGEMFRDNEIASVYVLHRDISESELKLQEEELSGVEWHDYEEVMRAICQHDPAYCVPSGGLELLGQFISAEQRGKIDA